MTGLPTNESNLQPLEYEVKIPAGSFPLLANVDLFRTVQVLNYRVIKFAVRQISAITATLCNV
jgi:hypothetical protein